MPRYGSVGGAGGGGVRPLACGDKASLLARRYKLTAAQPLNELARTERAERSGANE